MALSYFSYPKEQLDQIIESAVSEYDTEYGKPDKIQRSYYDTSKEGIVCFVNQIRFYLEAKKVVFLTPTEIIVIPFEKINGYKVVDLLAGNKELLSATTTTTTTDTGSLIKRAVIGGVIGGGVGALIGGVTADKTSTTTKTTELPKSVAERYGIILPPNDYELTIDIDDILFPQIKVFFELFKEQVEEVGASLNVIIKRNAEHIDDCKSDVIKKAFDVEAIAKKLGYDSQKAYPKYNTLSDDKGGSKYALFALAIVLGTLALLFSC